MKLARGCHLLVLRGLLGPFHSRLCTIMNCSSYVVMMVIKLINNHLTLWILFLINDHTYIYTHYPFYIFEVGTWITRGYCSGVVRTVRDRVKHVDGGGH